jgi:mRNA interferase RelE/StbE
MEIVFSKTAIKFLEKLSAKEIEKIREKLNSLLQIIEAEGIILSNELDIKSLKGNWKGYLRMRVGKVRIVFTINADLDQLEVYDIDFRGNVYKTLSLHTRKDCIIF